MIKLPLRRFDQFPGAPICNLAQNLNGIVRAVVQEEL